MSKTISNDDDTIDSRDIVARIEELESEREELSDAVDCKAEGLEEIKNEVPEEGQEEAHQQKVEAAEGEHNDAIADLEIWDDDEGKELKALKELVEEAEGYSDDWRHGAVLVRDSYFEEYAQQLCEDIGDMPRDFPDYIVIDWEATAENIQQDYTSVDYDGVTYWVR